MRIIKAAAISFFWTLLFVICFASFLYALGNINNFAERTQLFLLKTVFFTSLPLALCGIINIILIIKLRGGKVKDHPVFNIMLYFIFSAFGFLLFLASTVILVVIKGNAE